MARMQFPVGQFYKNFSCDFGSAFNVFLQRVRQKYGNQNGSLQLGLPPIFSIKNSNQTAS